MHIGDIEQPITLCTEHGEIEGIPAQFDIEDWGLKFLGFYIGTAWITPALFAQMAIDGELERQTGIVNRWWTEEGEREYRRGVYARMAAE